MMRSLQLHTRLLNAKLARAAYGQSWKKIMLETMYQIPSLSEAHACQITEDSVLGKSPPELINTASEALKTA
jgi:ATP-dependent protease Clp ATPase subunit